MCIKNTPTDIVVLICQHNCVCVCVCVCVPCIHQQRDCGREDIPIWRNVSHASLWDDLRDRTGGRETEREREKERDVRRAEGWCRNIWANEKINHRCVCALTQRVAPGCGTLHVKVVALVEAPPFGPVGEVVGGGLFERQLFGQSLVLLLRHHNVVAGRHKVVAGAGNIDVGLRGRGVARRGPGRGLVPVCPRLQVCWANQNKREWEGNDGKDAELCGFQSEWKVRKSTQVVFSFDCLRNNKCIKHFFYKVGLYEVQGQTLEEQTQD